MPFGPGGIDEIEVGAVVKEELGDQELCPGVNLGLEVVRSVSRSGASDAPPEAGPADREVVLRADVAGQLRRAAETALGLDEVGFTAGGSRAQGEDVVDAGIPEPFQRRVEAIRGLADASSDGPSPRARTSSLRAVVMSTVPSRVRAAGPVGSRRRNRVRVRPAAGRCQELGAALVGLRGSPTEDGAFRADYLANAHPESLNDRRLSPGRGPGRSRPARRCGGGSRGRAGRAVLHVLDVKLDPLVPRIPARPEPGAQPVIPGGPRAGDADAACESATWAGIVGRDRPGPSHPARRCTRLGSSSSEVRAQPAADPVTRGSSRPTDGANSDRIRAGIIVPSFSISNFHP